MKRLAFLIFFLSADIALAKTTDNTTTYNERTWCLTICGR